MLLMEQGSVVMDLIEVPLSPLWKTERMNEWTRILANYSSVSGVMLFRLDKPTASEFLGAKLS